MTYYTLTLKCRIREKWSAEFGNHAYHMVRAEMVEVRSSPTYRANYGGARIIKTSDNQTAIDAAVDRMNGESI